MIWPNLLTLNLPWTIAVLLFGALEYLMPELTRAEVMFSVTVEPTVRASTTGTAIIRRYRRTLVATMTAAMIVALNPIEALGRWNAPLAFAVQYAGFVVALFVARRQTQKYAAPQSTWREAELVARTSSSALTIGVALPLVAICATGLWSYTHWDALPELYPVHWMWDGEPDVWVPRTPFHVYGMLGLLGGSSALMAILCFGLMFWSRRPQFGASAKFDRLFLTGSLALLIVGEYLLAGTAMLPLGFGASGQELLTFVVLATASIYLMMLGHGTPIHHAGGDVTPDRAWKLGIIYFNPDDPAFLVEKRFGIGWTLNFGHRWGWLVIGAALIPMALGLAFVISAQT